MTIQWIIKINSNISFTITTRDISRTSHNDKQLCMQENNTDKESNEHTRNKKTENYIDLASGWSPLYVAAQDNQYRVKKTQEMQANNWCTQDSQDLPQL